MNPEPCGKFERGDPSDCKKIAEGFDSWEGSENQIYGFRTADGYSYNFETNTKKASALDADKTLWLTEQDNPSPILNDVEAYRKKRNVGFNEDSYTYAYVMTRSDGSIWAYHFNGVGMDIPVMIKAPIGTASYALGDVNLDGKVNTSDARLVLRGAATLETLTAQQRKRQGRHLRRAQDPARRGESRSILTVSILERKFIRNEIETC